MSVPSELGDILDRFAAHLGSQRPRLANATTGLSAAQVWRVDAGDRAYCLRGWPLEHPSAERLAWMHGILAAAGASGLKYVPVPLFDRFGQTFFERRERRWELTPWLPGAADFLENPTPERLRSAAVALARFHMTTAANDQPVELVPGLLERRQRLGEWWGGGLDRLRRELRSEPATPRILLAEHFISEFLRRAPLVAEDLERLIRTRVRLQPCIRDVHAEHMLFTGDEVTGLIDYGAMRNDCVVGDLVRLLTSFCGHDESDWAVGINAYAAIWPLSPEELAMLPVWRRSSLLLSAMNWLEWLYVERRTFADQTKVDRRLAELRNLLGKLT